MNFTELQLALQTLTNRTITQTEIADALNVTRSTINIRAKRNSILKVEELNKIEKYFKVKLPKYTPIKNDSKAIVEVIQNHFELSGNEQQFLEAFFTSKNTRVMAFLFINAMNGDEDATDICKRILNNPDLAKAFIE